MSERDDGGPAFPRPAHTTDRQSDWVEISSELVGMSLRDWFAGQIAAHQCHMAATGTNAWSPETLAKFAYQIADALLAEKAK